MRNKDIIDRIFALSDTLLKPLLKGDEPMALNARETIKNLLEQGHAELVIDVHKGMVTSVSVGGLDVAHTLRDHDTHRACHACGAWTPDDKLVLYTTLNFHKPNETYLLCPACRTKRREKEA